MVNPPAASKILSSFDCVYLGITENNFDISIFPNPTQDFLNVNIQANANYKVYSALGQLLSSGEITQNENQIDFSDFTQGIYYLRVADETLKVVKD